MTILLAEYRAHRAQRHNRHEALNALSRRFDMDRATVAGAISRAEQDEARFERTRGGGGRVEKLARPDTPTRRSLARAAEFSGNAAALGRVV